MKLTKGLEQAVCIITLLSTQDSGAPLASDAISERLLVSPSYLKKIMRKLVVKNIIRSVPGNNGGFFLARSPERISLFEIVAAVEGETNSYPNSGLIKQVFGDIRKEAAEKGETILTEAFSAADQVWKDALKKQTVADLLLETLGRDELPYTNWNEINPELHF
ncbi:rrf2 family protein [Listeria fleischmannii 1991]|uniref:HTH-type transcriptional regulator iscR n=2 Tax=Listeria fleischmannii TaxID=1069827 RepID=A0A2X3HHQ2_9LIST|nr:Rrf2 family transcriptional regulator [Listeria fleischmannii]EMG26850.1 Rrf2 family transcriptional regulator [Listeria fleischmannii subsp. fleischmannii LU2006-1]KMT58959.1 rrf2 family protein [Listeria fleischmannii 1991]SQC72113.1 HTH-type transcriptional regulator iscR [Listeria fleischmannii subsp. fleischmannii]